MRKENHSWEEIFQGKESRGCCRSSVAGIYAESVPLRGSRFHSFFPPSASECAESASGPSFFFPIPFLSFFKFFHTAHGSCKVVGARRMAAAVCMYGTSVVFLCESGLSVYITGYHLARHLVPSMLFKYFLDDIINA